MLVTDQGICLRTRDFSETSQIVTFLTRDHGRVGAIAKGAKRARSSVGGTLEIFTHGPLLYYEAPQGGLNTLREFAPRHDVVVGLSRFMDAYYCALLAAELLAKLTEEHDPHPDLFAATLTFLQEISRPDGPRPEGAAHAGLLSFLQILLEAIGLRPQWEACGNCHAARTDLRGEVYFSSRISSLVCRDCEASFPDRLLVSPGVLACLGPEAGGRTAPPATARAAVALLVDHFTQLMHRRPKTAKYVVGR